LSSGAVFRILRVTVCGRKSAPCLFDGAFRDAIFPWIGRRRRQDFGFIVATPKGGRSASSTGSGRGNVWRKRPPGPIIPRRHYFRPVCCAVQQAGLLKPGRRHPHPNTAAVCDPIQRRREPCLSI
jgi:hypothetical protein